MDINRVVFVPLYFLMALIVVSLLFGVATGILIIKQFAVTLFLVVVAMFVSFLGIVAFGCIFSDVVDLLKDKPDHHWDR